MSPLTSADLKHRIAIRRPIPADDGHGGANIVWQDVCQPWAEVTGLPGRESVLDHALQGIAVYRLRIWYRDGIQPSDQARYGSIELNIRSAVDPDGNRHELVILADTATVEA